MLRSPSVAATCRPSRHAYQSPPGMLGGALPACRPVITTTITVTINEGDPFVAVYLPRHQGGAMHILVIASFHGVRTFVV